jgi:methionyl-tRNA formyltransferase
MRVVFFGTPDFAIPTLQRLLDWSECEVLAVVSQPDRPKGRGKTLQPTPVKALAERHGIPVWQPERLRKSAETLASLAQLQADAFVVVAYGQILSPQVLAMPRLGCINVHGSLLPAYRGAAPIQWAIARGETETGITTMLMDAGMDTGAMLLKAAVPISPEATAVELAAILAPLGADLLAETLLKLDAGEIEPEPQQNEFATYAPLLSKTDFQIDWQRSARDLHNQIRALSPNCFTGFNSKRLRVIRSVLPLNALTPPGNRIPGTVVEILKGKGITVQTGDGLLHLQQVQMEGKAVQSAWDFANGMRLTVGQYFSLEQ